MLRPIAFALALLAALPTAAAFPAAAQGRYEGELAYGDDTLTSGEFSDTYPVALRAGQWVEVVMRSGDFDPYLILRPPSCTSAGGACDGQTDNDDFFSDGSSFLWVEATEGGTWDVLATSYAPGDKGAYTLDVIVHDDDAGPQTEGVMLGAARSVRGALAEGDATLRSGEFLDRYAFVGRAGEHVAVDLRSDDFDPYLIFQRPDGTQEDNDDWQGALTHARIEQTLPVSGTYVVLVTSYAVGETGSYILDIQPGAEPSGDPFTK
jgi:hypothetical protein